MNCSRKGLGETDPKVVAQLTQQLEAKLDAYEQLLSKTKYLAGDVSPSTVMNARYNN